MSGFIADIGYLGVRKEATKGTPLTPNIYLPIFSQNLSINQNVEDIDPIVGLKAMRLSSIRGQRDFRGEIVFLGEPNTAGYIFDMLLNRTSTSGSNPYTHVFALNTTDPNSYTIDVAVGRSVHRYWGVQAREVSMQSDKNRIKLSVAVSAMGANTGALITGVSTNTLTLSSEYDPVPTRGFLASDLVRIFLANGSVVDTTVSSVTNTTVVVASAGGAAANDFITLRPATPTLSLVDYLQWARTEFRFGADATAALTASQTQLEQGSGFKLSHQIVPEEGAKRSGSYDPVALIRGKGDAELTAKLFFDSPAEMSRFREQSKRACVIRMFSGANSANTYELRVTLNNLVWAEEKVNVEVGNVLFNELEAKTRYDTTDAAMFGVTVINAVATI